MALTPFQHHVCRLIARRHVAAGESYLAGGAALNTMLRAPRRSRDLDWFHDTTEAVASSVRSDRATLERDGCAVRTIREREGFAEALVTRGDEGVLLQWTADSAYRFFPLVEHEDLGLALHPFDLATNKVLALVGRLEPRDWIDTITCHDRVQPLGFLAWAACGKDPGFSPAAILDQAGRSARYTDAELESLEFEGPAPSAAELSRRWHDALGDARAVVAALPADEAGTCVLGADLALFRGDRVALAEALASGSLRYHVGSIRGAWPTARRA